MEKVSKINFNGLYYAKSAIFKDEIKNGVKPYLLDNNPDKSLKDIIENSPIFKDLKDKTDVFISSYIDEDSEIYTRHIRAIFKDPYRKFNNIPDTINVEASGNTNETIFEKLKEIITKLPNYENLRGKNGRGIFSLEENLTDKNMTDAYITVGL